MKSPSTSLARLPSALNRTSAASREVGSGLTVSRVTPGDPRGPYGNVIFFSMPRRPQPNIAARAKCGFSYGQPSNRGIWRTEVFSTGKGGGGVCVCGGDRRAWTTHIGTGYADLEACRTGWTARRRDDPDACRSGVPAVRRSIWRPERLNSAVRSWGTARLALTAPPIRRLYELMLGQNMGITALSCAHRWRLQPGSLTVRQTLYQSRQEPLGLLRDECQVFVVCVLPPATLEILFRRGKGVLPLGVP